MRRDSVSENSSFAYSSVHCELFSRSYITHSSSAGSLTIALHSIYDQQKTRTFSTSPLVASFNSMASGVVWKSSAEAIPPVPSKTGFFVVKSS